MGKNKKQKQAQNQVQENNNNNNAVQKQNQQQGNANQKQYQQQKSNNQNQHQNKQNNPQQNQKQSNNNSQKNQKQAPKFNNNQQAKKESRSAYDELLDMIPDDYGYEDVEDNLTDDELIEGIKRLLDGDEDEGIKRFFDEDEDEGIKRFFDEDEDEDKSDGECADDIEDISDEDDEIDSSIYHSVDEWMDSIAPVTVSFANLMSQLSRKYPLVFGFQELFNDIWVFRNLNRNFLPTVYSGSSYERALAFVSNIEDAREKILDTLDFLEPFNLMTPALLMEIKDTLTTNSIAIDVLMEVWYDKEEEREHGCENCTDGDCTGCPHVQR